MASVPDLYRVLVCFEGLVVAGYLDLGFELGLVVFEFERGHSAVLCGRGLCGCFGDLLVRSELALRFRLDNASLRSLLLFTDSDFLRSGGVALLWLRSLLLFGSLLLCKNLLFFLLSLLYGLVFHFRLHLIIIRPILQLLDVGNVEKAVFCDDF